MNSDVIITCAITGDDTKVTKSPHCAVTPEQIANPRSRRRRPAPPSCTSTCAIRKPARSAWRPRHYREVVKRIRESKVDVIVNLTCGMGGYICVGEQRSQGYPGAGHAISSARKSACGTSSICARRACTGPTSRRSTAAA